MIDPIQIKQDVLKGKIKFWIEGERLYCSDTNPATTTVTIPHYGASVDLRIKSQ